MNELLTAHVDHLEARGRQTRTIEGYRSITRAIGRDATFGKTQLDKLTVKAIDDFYNRLGRDRGLAPASIQRYHALLRSAFKQAMAWGWTTTSPVLLATPPSVRRVGRKIPTPDVVAQPLDAAARSRNAEKSIAFRLLAATGSRRGEVCGLRWDSVDLDTGRIEIRAAMAQLMTGAVMEKDPKSHQIRVVTIDSRTRALLAGHHERQQCDALALGATLSNRASVLADLSIDAEGLAPTHPNRLTQAFGRLRHKIPGAEELRLHDLRHRYASTQLDAGEPLPAVAARIGDHVETLAKVYAHKGHRGDQEAADHIPGCSTADTPRRQWRCLNLRRRRQHSHERPPGNSQPVAQPQRRDRPDPYQLIGRRP